VRWSGLVPSQSVVKGAPRDISCRTPCTRGVNVKNINSNIEHTITIGHLCVPLLGAGQQALAQLHQGVVVGGVGGMLLARVDHLAGRAWHLDLREAGQVCVRQLGRGRKGI
jgi:hypothetical protein